MNSIAVVIPCYKVLNSICDVVDGVLRNDLIDLIIVVDDFCPEQSGRIVEKNFSSTKQVKVVYHDNNMGVGGAVMTGYKKAIDFGADIIVKVDGDGQMDPSYLGNLISPIRDGQADYTKGNRFYDVESTIQMPMIRLIGNILLSFLTKLSSGYWNIFDPTNGYTAISASVACRLPFNKINRGYFFESDVIFRLNILRAVIVDIAMPATYGDEKSNLNVLLETPRFFVLNLKNFFKRVVYNYFVRDFNFASIELMFGSILISFGTVFGLISWVEVLEKEVLASSGTVMLSALPIIIGTQLLLGFLNYDMNNIPEVPLSGSRHDSW